jgi:hypothetical protein
VAEFRPIADPGETPRANRVEILLMNREVGAAVLAAVAPLGARRAARRTAHHRGVVPLGLRNRYRRAAIAAEPAANGPAAGVVLAFALWAGNKQSHGFQLTSRRCPLQWGASKGGENLYLSSWQAYPPLETHNRRGMIGNYYFPGICQEQRLPTPLILT